MKQLQSAGLLPVQLGLIKPMPTDLDPSSESSTPLDDLEERLKKRGRIMNFLRQTNKLTPRGFLKWTNEEDETIRRLWRSESASQIASQLKGRSRNSVIGRAQRLGLGGTVKLTIQRQPSMRASALKAMTPEERYQWQLKEDEKKRRQKSESNRRYYFKRKGSEEPLSAPRLRVAKTRDPNAKEPQSLRLTLMELGSLTTDRQCRYIASDDPKNYSFCGHKTHEEGDAYCEYHMNLTHSKSNRSGDYNV